jgi:hypothetical protein
MGYRVWGLRSALCPWRSLRLCASRLFCLLLIDDTLIAQRSALCVLRFALVS